MEKDKDGLSPLHLACAGGHTKVVEKLLEHDHCPDPREIIDNYGRNMVHIAALMGKFDVIKYILQDDGLVDMINDQDNEGNTPLHLATKKCHPKVVHALTWNERVDLTSVNKKNETALDISLKYKPNNPSLRQRLVWTALKSACVVQHAEKGSHSIKVPLPQSGIYYQRWQNENMDLYKDRINTLILVSTIITTVAFSTGITLPGGTNSSDPGHGMALMLKHAWFKLFIFCITVSMYGSISAIIILIWAQLGDITLAIYSLKVAMPVLGVTLTSLSVAFMAAVHLVISDLSWLATTIMVLCVIFILMLLFLYVLLCWFPSESRNPFIRRISYYPFLFETWLDKQDD
ncbi:protein ACCELERATED CELL DEATH 6-like [Cajanus cajan]|uniref:protein ACCELERATED CELL DEATH 6-like n=1 Tax=Cajanus cajan TaxID=3821 RepID=UPI00098D9556|nr:protein ACCELERATED CELL DEATH 6-like [Cajanus cajan]